MTARKDLPGAFGSHNIITYRETTEEERHRARLTVVGMLGLLDGAS